MLRWVVETSLKFRLLVVALAAGVLALGVIQLQNARVDALPEFSPPYIEIQTEALGLSAKEVEQLITVPLEADLLNGVAFLEELRSDSVPGLSSIVMVFEPGTDVYKARQLVAERMTQAHALPNVSRPPVMLEPVSSASRAMVLGMSSQKLSLIDQSVLARWTIRPRLLGVPGVSSVSVFGQRERQLQVQVDPAALNAKGLGLADIIQTTGNATWFSPLTFLEASTPGTGGFVDTPNQRIAVQNVSPIRNADTLAQVSVEGHPGLRLGDVARVVEDHQLLIGDGIVADTSGLMIVIEKFPDANTLEVTRGVEAALKDLAPGLSDVNIGSTVYRPASFVESAMSNIGLTLLIGIALAIVVIALFVFAWRTAVVTVITIALAASLAVVVLDRFGVMLNLLVVLGLVAALATVIANAVSDTEAVARRQREHGASNGESGGAILHTVLAMRRSATLAALIVALAVTPVFFVPGAAGRFVAQLAIAYLVALASAMLVALVVVPVLCSLLAPRSVTDRKPPPAERLLHQSYARLGRWVAPSARTAVIAGLVVVVAGAAMVPLWSVSLMPTLREPDLLVTFDGTEGAARPEMTRITAAATAELRALPGVSQVGAHVGRGLQSDKVRDVNAAEIWVRIDPAADYDATVASVEEVVHGYPGLRREVQTYLGDRSDTVLTSGDTELRVRIFGEDSAVLSAKADEVQRMLTAVDGLQNAAVQRPPLKPTVQVEVDLAAAQRYNIKPGDVRRTVATLIAGLEVGSLFENQKVFEVVVWSTPELRNSVTSVQNLLVDRPDGAGQVRVGDIAKVQVTPAPAVVQRTSSSRFLDVAATVSGRTSGAVSADVAQRLAGIQFPFEYRAEIVGNDVQLQVGLWRVVGVAVVALVLLYLLLQSALGSWSLALVVVASLPVALAGGAIAAVLGGGVASLGTVVGLVVIAALALHQLLALLQGYQEIRREARSAELAGVVRRGTRERLVPVVATALAVAVALLPMVIVGPVAGLELLHPMAVTVLGGLITMVVLTLFLMPGFYSALTERPRDDDEAMAAPAPAAKPATEPGDLVSTTGPSA